MKFTYGIPSIGLLCPCALPFVMHGCVKVIRRYTVHVEPIESIPASPHNRYHVAVVHVCAGPPPVKPGITAGAICMATSCGAPATAAFQMHGSLNQEACLYMCGNQCFLDELQSSGDLSRSLQALQRYYIYSSVATSGSRCMRI